MNVKALVNRILTNLPSYKSADGHLLGELQGWSAGREGVCGVYEGRHGVLDATVVVSTDGFHTYSDGRWQLTRFDSIVGVEPPAKDPVSGWLTVTLEGGERRRIPAMADPGDPFEFWRLIMRVQRALGLPVSA